ncbi:hypothetical protein N337_05168, partial [Phoenicopterus ruber ruber]
MVVLSGFRITLARSLFTCSARRIRIRRENALEKKKRCRRDGFQPVIIEIEENHLGFGSLQDEITELFHFQAGLEGQLQLRAFDHNIG